MSFRASNLPSRHLSVSTDNLGVLPTALSIIITIIASIITTIKHIISLSVQTCLAKYLRCFSALHITKSVPLKRPLGVLQVIVDLIELVDLPIQLNVDGVCLLVHYVDVLLDALQGVQALLLRRVTQLDHLLALVGCFGCRRAVGEQLLLGCALVA